MDIKIDYRFPNFSHFFSSLAILCCILWSYWVGWTWKYVDQIVIHRLNRKNGIKVLNRRSFLGLRSIFLFLGFWTFSLSSKSTVNFHAHQNPRIWPDNRMERYSNGSMYDKLSIYTLKYNWKMPRKNLAIVWTFSSKFENFSTSFNPIRISQNACKMDQRARARK